MDAKSVLVLVLFNISILYGQSRAGDCSLPCAPNIPCHTAAVGPFSTSTSLVCSKSRWFKGDDLCSLETFRSYSDCDNKNNCDVPSSEYLFEETTYFCCRSPGAADWECMLLTIAPTVNHSVPQFVTVGKEETAYTVILSKPRPSGFPGLDVQLVMTNGSNQSAMVMSIPTTTDISFKDSLTYILVHTFHIPFSVNESTTLRLRFEEILNASSWSTTPVYTDSLVYTDIHIVSVSGTTTPPGSGQSSEKTEGIEGTTPTPRDICYGPPLISITTVSVAIVTATLASLVTGIICCCANRNKREKVSHPGEFVPSPPQPASAQSVTVPSALALRPMTPGYNSAATTPAGLTPSSESTALLPGLGHRGGVANPLHYRQNSRDSISTANTTTTTITPTEGERLLSGSTGLTGSTGSSGSGSAQVSAGGDTSTNMRQTLDIIEGGVGWTSISVGCEPAVNVPRLSTGSEVRGGDPRHHVYSTVKDTFSSERSITVNQQQSSLSQLYHQNHRDHEQYHVPTSSATLPSGSEMLSFSPPLPSNQPCYASQGSRMHLTEDLALHSNVSNV